MKTTRLMKVLMLAVLTATCSMPAFAQQNTEQKQIPEGKWVLESVAASEVNVQVPFSVDSIGFEVPAEIDIQQDEITFVRKEAVEKVKYDAVAKAGSLCFSVCAEWSMVGNKLLLQWGQDIDSPSSSWRMRTITLSYRQK